jgi:hypothetical protein
VRPLDVVELEGSRDRLEHVFGDAPDVAAFELRVAHERDFRQISGARIGGILMSFEGTCRIEGCGRKLHCPDLCSTHEKRRQRGDP